MSKKALFIDGGAYIYRYYYGMPKEWTSTGKPTWMVKGCTTAMRRLMADFKPDYVCFVFDPHGDDTWRHQLYPGYKCMRPPMPDFLRMQIPILKEFLDALGIPWVVSSEDEGDDYIATLAWEAEEECDVIVATPDKDLCQIVNDKISLYDGRKGVVLKREDVFQKMRVYPEKVSELLALIGDEVDGIPGVIGLGPVKASKLLEEYGDLKNLIANIKKIPGMTGERLRSQKKFLEISHKLATIIPVKEYIDYTVCKPTGVNFEKLIEVTKKYEMVEWHDYLVLNNGTV